MEFQHREDKNFFKTLLGAERDEDFINFLELFDFRPAIIKRKEFNNQRNKILAQLEERHGHICMLRYANCDLSSGMQVDHIIPLSTNKLNKELRELKAEKGKKVVTQSIGSNHINNLILACANCNGHKKHRFLEPERLQEILRLKKENGN